MSKPPITPQDYGHPDNILDGNPVSKNAGEEEPADPRLDPEVGENYGLNRPGEEVVADETLAGSPSID